MNQRTDIVKSLIISSPLPNFPMERALAELGRALVFEALSPEPGDLRSNRRLDSSRHLYSPSRHRALRFDHRNRDRLEYFASGRDPRFQSSPLAGLPFGTKTRWRARRWAHSGQYAKHPPCRTYRRKALLHDLAPELRLAWCSN